MEYCFSLRSFSKTNISVAALIYITMCASYISQVIHIVEKEEEAAKLPHTLVILQSSAGKIISWHFNLLVPMKSHLTGRNY